MRDCENNVLDSTLCWSCRRPIDVFKCSWVEDYVPVEGWEAEVHEIKTLKDKNGNLIPSYKVKSCPEYAPFDTKMKYRDPKHHFTNSGCHNFFVTFILNSLIDYKKMLLKIMSTEPNDILESFALDFNIMQKFLYDDATMYDYDLDYLSYMAEKNVGWLEWLPKNKSRYKDILAFRNHAREREE